MPKYKNYINKHTKNGDIHTIENIVNMSFGDVARREKELESQYNQIGIPSDADMQNSSNVVFVHEYTRDDGTIVRAHWRSKPENNGTFEMNNNETNYINSNLNNLFSADTDAPSSIMLKGNIEYNEKSRKKVSELIDDIINKLKEPLKNKTNDIKLKLKTMANSLGKVKNISNKSINSLEYLSKQYLEKQKEYKNKKNTEVLSSAGGYIKPVNSSRNYDALDTTCINYNIKQNQNRPDAKQMLEIGIYGVDSYQDNSQFKRIKNGSANHYNKKYNLTGNKTIPSDMKGIEFSKNSDFAKRIVADTTFKNTIMKSYDKKTNSFPQKIELDFIGNQNLNYSIGHGTFLNAKKTKDGYVEGIVFDKYDYSLHYYEYYKKYPATLYNNGALWLHKLNKLEYYYYFIPVRFKY